MGFSGGIALSKRLKELKAALREFYGALSELDMGLNVKKMPPKPKALVDYERCKALGLPLVEGGVLDQPYIWLQEVAVIIEEEELWKALRRRSRQTEAP